MVRVCVRVLLGSMKGCVSNSSKMLPAVIKERVMRGKSDERKEW